MRRPAIVGGGHGAVVVRVAGHSLVAAPPHVSVGAHVAGGLDLGKGNERREGEVDLRGSWRNRMSRPLNFSVAQGRPSGTGMDGVRLVAGGRSGGEDDRRYSSVVDLPAQISRAKQTTCRPEIAAD